MSTFIGLLFGVILTVIVYEIKLIPSLLAIQYRIVRRVTTSVATVPLPSTEVVEIYQRYDGFEYPATKRIG